MKEKIQEICKELCGRDVAPDEQLIATKLMDSYKLMELMCSLEEVFRITFFPEEMQNLNHFSSVNAIVDIVSKKQREENTLCLEAVQR